jgi:hypothetical protein
MEFKFSPLTVALVAMLMAATAFLILAVFHDVSGTPQGGGMTVTPDTPEGNTKVDLSIQFGNGTLGQLSQNFTEEEGNDLVAFVNSLIVGDADTDTDTEEEEDSSDTGSGTSDSEGGDSGDNGGNGRDDNTGDQGGDDESPGISQGIIPLPNNPEEPKEPSQPTDPNATIYHCETLDTSCPYFNST